MKRKFELIKAKGNFICNKCGNQRAIKRKGRIYCSKHKKYGCDTNEQMEISRKNNK